MTSPLISVIICTHNPRQDFFLRVLDALQLQTLSPTHWELLIVDNASDIPVQEQLSAANLLHTFSNIRVVSEETLGLTAARLRGHQEAKGTWLVYVDDDNVLSSHYLEAVYAIAQTHSDIGVFSGKSLPEFEVEPEAWITSFYQVLAIRDLGDKTLISAPESHQTDKHYPDYAPAGAGMVVHKQAFQLYVNRVSQDQRSLALGRRGKKLTSGEDNDIVLTIFNAGWKVGYFPQLQLTHLISASRLDRSYMARLNRAATRSWVYVLDIHGIRYWPKIPHWTVIPRQIKAFLTHQAWRSPEAYIRWCGSCGQIEARGALS